MGVRCFIRYLQFTPPMVRSSRHRRKYCTHRMLGLQWYTFGRLGSIGTVALHQHKLSMGHDWDVCDGCDPYPRRRTSPPRLLRDLSHLPSAPGDACYRWCVGSHRQGKPSARTIPPTLSASLGGRNCVANFSDRLLQLQYDEWFHTNHGGSPAC